MNKKVEEKKEIENKEVNGEGSITEISDEISGIIDEYEGLTL